MALKQEAIFYSIDTHLNPFLRVLDANKGVEPRTSLDIIPSESREIVTAIRLVFDSVADENARRGGKPSPKDIINEIESKVPGVKFAGNENVGFYIVPGINKISDEDIKRNLVIASLNFDKGTAEELAIGHFHIGAKAGRHELPGEFTEVWRSPKMLKRTAGLVWADAEGNLETHFRHEGIRIGMHGSRDDYSAVAKLSEEERDDQDIPNFYFGPYWGGVDMRSQVCPPIKTLKS